MGGLSKTLSNIQSKVSPLTKSFDKKLENGVYGEGWDAEPVDPAAAPAPIVMPTADDEMLKRTKRRSAGRQLARSGRASTILTDYANEKL